MGGLDYNNALAIFFPFYVAAEIPSNLMMKWTRPSLWIPFIMLLWGFCCVMLGVVKNYAGLMAVRALLGVAEGGLFPGITFYITQWYRRQECGLRMAIFFSAATAAGAFGGLLARAIQEMKNVAGLASWQWIFILEGIATFIVGGSAFYFMYDYPDTAKFLSNQERIEVHRRLEADRSSLADEFDLKYFMHAMKDWKIWVHCISTVGIFTPLYSFSLFLPTIIKTLGYTNNTAQLMTVPPYVVACAFCIGAGYAADKHGQRGIYMIFFSLLSVSGFIMLIASESAHVKYGGTFLAASGIYPNVPQCVAWNGNNIGGSTKRSVGIAMQVMIGNLGGVISAYLFLPKDSPHFGSGHAALIGLNSMSAVLSVGMTLYLRRENRRRDRAAVKKIEEYTAEEKMAEREMGDSASFFRYTV
ncbi:high-affinity nicotinic acid transporter [Aulographum hederae CBS 113979]|uniref:High-affinity nicotinic acid transporter n=1 Tax=Aulographum hederae CBS 113979 TaxID=1176131 RepID=A0A6G1GUF5_9PEZI|nr:high-affinity nicotinic acid transporter [Aulographum hederae CBS 113979]